MSFEDKVRAAIVEAFKAGMDAQTVADAIARVIREVGEERTQAAAAAVWGNKS